MAAKGFGNLRISCSRATVGQGSARGEGWGGFGEILIRRDEDQAASPVLRRRPVRGAALDGSQVVGSVRAESAKIIIVYY